MGLAGRRAKQRISADPRNLAWADDAAKFGSNYLSKFGWDASKGLGVNGEGRTSHIKVTHKLDMLGIGAAHQKDPNGIAWKQNRDFENLLKRLNENIQADSSPAEEAKGEESIDEEDSDSSATERKRKRKGKKKQKSEEEEKAKKKRKKNSENGAETMEVTKTQDKPAESIAPTRPVVPRNRAHRARAIASKSIASKSSVHIAEILGIACTPSTSSGSETPADGKLTPIEDDTITLEKLTTSTKSVADYFKEKLLAKSSKSGTQSPLTPHFKEDPYDTPRGGLGASQLKMDIGTPDAESQRIGLSKFSSLMSSSFLSSRVLSTDPSTEDSTPSGSEVPAKTKKEKRKKESGKDEESEAARELRKKEKKRQKAAQEAGETTEKDVGDHESVIEQKSKKEKKKEKRRKDLDVGHEAAEEEGTAALSKEERRRLRKERKNHKESSS
ncbi:hypothetical protein C0995_003682 [Termitomyces sp. Mi166|nr:hypothetical protein C0995_003682 [Termitomyces sp. Mi166\